MLSIVPVIAALVLIGSVCWQTDAGRWAWTWMTWIRRSVHADCR